MRVKVSRQNTIWDASDEILNVKSMQDHRPVKRLCSSIREYFSKIGIELPADELLGRVPSMVRTAMPNTQAYLINDDIVLLYDSTTVKGAEYPSYLSLNPPFVCSINRLKSKQLGTIDLDMPPYYR